MSLCCHDDYSRTGNINISDVNILAGFQSWVDQRGENSVSDINEFKSYYAKLVAQGVLPSYRMMLKYYQLIREIY